MTIDAQERRTTCFNLLTRTFSLVVQKARNNPFVLQHERPHRMGIDTRTQVKMDGDLLTSQQDEKIRRSTSPLPRRDNEPLFLRSANSEQARGEQCCGASLRDGLRAEVLAITVL